MQIHAYTVVHNEAYLLPYWLRHYATFADHLFVLDDGSTDATAAIIDACPLATRLPYPYATGLDDTLLQDAYHEAIQTHSAGATWVMCPDSDELLYHPYMRGALAEMHTRGMHCVGSTAWFMVADAPPQTDGHLYDVVRLGVRPRKTSRRYTYDKAIIFDPATPIRLGAGRHQTHVPDGWPVADIGVKLLHYYYLGADYIEARLRKNCDRMLSLDPAAREAIFTTRLFNARRAYARARTRAIPVL